MNDYAKLLMVILFWAGNYPFWAGNYQLGKFALDELSPLVLTAARAVLAAPLLLLVARASAPLAAPPGRRDYLAFVVLGLTGLAASVLLGDPAERLGGDWAVGGGGAAHGGQGLAGHAMAGANVRRRARAGAALARGRRRVAGAVAGAARLGGRRTATFLNLMPFVVIALARALLGETVHAYHVVDAALVIAGVVLTTR